VTLIRTNFDRRRGSREADKGLTLLVDHDGMKIDVRQSAGRGVELLAMHVGRHDDMVLLWQAQHNFVMPSCTGFQRGRMTMVTYVVLAKFTDQGIRNAKESPKRAEAFRQLAKTLEVTVKEIFWTQGRYDIVTIVEAPDESSAMSLSFSLGALGNVRTESLRAFSAAEMMTIVGKMV
jgi:uncharacterized protein with GYD domain